MAGYGFNKVILIGNLTADPELKTTQTGIPVTSFRIAVSRRYAKDTDDVQADFIDIVCWRKSAEFVTQYFTKGKKILIEGQLQTRSYLANDGSKRHVTEVVADNVSFVERAENGGQGAYAPQNAPQGDYTSRGGIPYPGAQNAPQAARQAQMPMSPEENYYEVGEDDDLPF